MHLNQKTIKTRIIDPFVQQLNLSRQEAEFEAMVLLEHFFRIKKEELLMGKTLILSIPEEALLSELIEKRLSNIPLQHLTGEGYFYGLKFFVDKHTLIPRPDSEILIDTALKLLEDRHGLKILDIGTGSGCLAITLAKLLNERLDTCVATDLSMDALKVAKQNAECNQVEKKIEFVQADLITEELKQLHFDLVISNPPYISTDELKSLQAEVRKEPILALQGLNNDDGLNYYRRISSLGLKSDYFLFEIGWKQKDEVESICRLKGYSTQAIKDLNNNWRAILCKT
jgi:release factor glutamine methyltransferase